MIIPPYVNRLIYSYYLSQKKPTNNEQSDPSTRFITYSLLNHPSKQLHTDKLEEKKLYLFSRDTILLPFFLKKVWIIYTGKVFQSLVVSKDILWHKTGEFIFTRKPYFFKKKKPKRKKLK